MKKKVIKSLKQTVKSLWVNIPIILGILILVSLVKYYLPVELLSTINNKFFAGLLSTLFGSIFAGNPINSYIIAGEFGDLSNNIIIVSAFLISWVTVGLVQIPAESYFFGKKYAILRNGISFLFSLIGAYAIYLLYNIF